jgi:heme/copper-type cytochrome/quinol oxidase subunit 2
MFKPMINENLCMKFVMSKNVILNELDESLKIEDKLEIITNHPDIVLVTDTLSKWAVVYQESNPPTLVVPLGEKVRYTITASDVVHGFWIPAFMIQQQNLPGVTNQLEFTANKIGEFPGRCNILCGRNHSQMIFKVKVVTPSEYKAYLETLKASVA